MLAAEAVAIVAERPLYNIAGAVDLDDDALDRAREPRSQVRSFDHSRIGAMPEYVAAQKALDDLARALDRETAEGTWEWGSRRDWIETVADMASVLSFADCCRGRHDLDGSEQYRYSLAIPYKIERRGDWLRCFYWCPVHQRAWTCGYSVRILDWS